MKQFFIPYLTFENSLEAAEYYRDILDGEITYIMKGSDTPDCPPDKLDMIMHLELKVKDNYIYMGDGPHKPTRQSVLLLDYRDLDEMKSHYEKMKKDSKIIEEMHDTFWGAVFGVLEDKYGFMWEFHFSKNRQD